MYRCIRAVKENEKERHLYQVTYIDVDNIRRKLNLWASDIDEARSKLLELRPDCARIQDIVDSDY